MWVLSEVRMQLIFIYKSVKVFDNKTYYNILLDPVRQIKEELNLTDYQP